MGVRLLGLKSLRPSSNWFDLAGFLSPYKVQVRLPLLKLGRRLAHPSFTVTSALMFRDTYWVLGTAWRRLLQGPVCLGPEVRKCT